MRLWTTLVGVILPAIGDFIGRLTAISQLSYYEFSEFLFKGRVLTYINPFYGVEFSHALPEALSTIIAIPVGVALSPAALLLEAMGLAGTPLWIALLLSAAVWGVLIAAISSLRKLLTGAFR